MAETIRVILHSTAALTWVGVFGYSLAETPQRSTRAVGWAAFAVVVATGMWGAFAADIGAATPAVQGLLFVKITFAISSAGTGAVAMLTSSRQIRGAMLITTIVLSAGAALLGFVLASVI